MIVVGVVTTFILYKYIVRKLSYWKNLNIPGPKPLPLIGNLWKVATFQRSMGTLLQELYNSDNGPLMGIFVFNDPILLVRSPNIAKHILITDFQFFYDRGGASPQHNEISSNLPFMKKNPEWRSVRTKITPAFSSAKQKIYFDIIKNVSENMKLFLGKHPGAYDAKTLCFDYAIEVAYASFLGIEVNCFESRKSILREKALEMWSFTLRNVFSQTAYFFKPFLVDLFRLNFFSHSVETFFVNIFWDSIKNIEEGKISSNVFLDMLNQKRKEDPIFGKYIFF